jgi:hypothetical protein
MNKLSHESAKQQGPVSEGVHLNGQRDTEHRLACLRADRSEAFTEPAGAREHVDKWYRVG